MTHSPNSRRRRTRTGFAILGCVVSLLASHAALGQSRGDFNGDGFDDLAIGVPGEDNGSIDAVGAVHVIYGTAAGLSSVGNQLLTDDSATEERLQFGYALASGDFDGDGFDDLAIGCPFEDGSSFDTDSGMVRVFYGAAGGLSTSLSDRWTQDYPGIIGSSSLSDNFGYCLAAGNFDGDGFDDLAIGVRQESLEEGLPSRAGAVQVLYGAPEGLRPNRNQLWHQDSPGILDDAESGDHFGSSLDSGDFNGDGVDDLAIGVVYEDVDTADAAGAVNVIYGSATGLSDSGNQFWHQDVPDVFGSAGGNDQFGFALAAGDFDGNGRDDLAIGVSGDNAGASDAGALHVFYGTASGLSAAGSQWFQQGLSGVHDSIEIGDKFGSVLAAGNFTGEGRDDLLVGVPDENAETGVVHALKGTAAGLVAVKLVPARSLGTPKRFGAALSAGDYNGDGLADVAIGVPGTIVSSVPDVGSVTVFAARTAFPRQFWNQDSPGIPELSNRSDLFGFSLSR